MTDVNDDLLENERVVYQTRLHWTLLLGPAMLIILGGLWFSTKGWKALVVLAIGLAWGIISYVKFNNSLIRVTNQRVIIRASFLIRKPYIISLADISLIDTYQPSLGAMLNFGKITIIHGAKFKSIFRMVSSPNEFAAAVRGQIAATRKSE
jgi:membrane protein YdbS with pleckstrin-like domain